jgi:gamma-glutamylcyclotransferase (GGCT)/AIG2-like uncharacterized protein YtfP
MGNTKIKKIDPSQIRYTPQEGEIIQSSIDNKFYIYKDGAWMLMNIDSSGVHMGLYDINKQIVAQLPVLTDTEVHDKAYSVYTLHAKFNNEFYMLYGKEISYFTLFKINDANYFTTEVIDCLNNIGDIKAIDTTEAQDALEIWVETEDGPTCLYLFPYDSGLVQVGE